eukprot:9470707-Pyramimonas_sp.AAC.1
MVTVPPLPPCLVPWPSRTVAAKSRWGCRGRRVLVSLYLQDSVGLDSCSLSLLYVLATYLGWSNAEARPWVVGGDWNVESRMIRGRHGRSKSERFSRHLLEQHVACVSGQRGARTIISYYRSLWSLELDFHRCALTASRKRIITRRSFSRAS